MKKIIKVLLVVTVLLVSSPVFADTSIHLSIETDTSSIYNQDINVTPCDSEGDGVMKITAYCALVQSNIASDWSGLWVNSINGVLNNDNSNGVYWMWLANLNTDTSNPDSSYNLSAKQYVLNSNDRILFYYNTNPLDVSVDDASPAVGKTIKISVKELGLDQSWNPVWNNAVGGKIVIGSDTFDLDVDGAYYLLISDLNVFSMKGQKTSFIDSKELVVTPVPSLDNISPVISIIGSNPISTAINGVYSDEGATANDDVDGVRTVTTTGSIDLSTAGTYILTYTSSDLSNNISTATRTVNVVNSSGGGGGSYYVSVPIKKVFDTQKAFNFLVSQQKEDGSFGEDLYTDWVGLSLASSPDLVIEKEKVKNYLLKQKLFSGQLTDYERVSIVLMSLGVNPYDVSGENYIKKITDSFDGVQFGDKNEDNDDIFALIVLQNAGFKQDEKIIKDAISFVLSAQQNDGSWDESIDMTGATIEALSVYKDAPEIKTALEKAKDFLKQNQKDTGGWNNVSSTSWVMEGILALGEKPEDWIKNEKTPVDYLVENQDVDGSIKNENFKNKIWETSYALSALSGKTWNQIMQKFDKPSVPVIIEIPVEVAKNQEDKEIKTEKILEIKDVKEVKETKKIAKVVSLKKANLNIDKLAGIAAQNTAAPIVAVEDKKSEPVQKRNWLVRFFARIFGF